MIQYPNTVIIASDIFPCAIEWSFFPAGNCPFANKTILIFLSLSPQIYDPVGSLNPKDFALNFLPHGGFTDGTVYHPYALVLL